MAKTALILITASSILFSACSWITDFVIANKSDDKITIIYQLKSYEHSGTGEMTCYDLEPPCIVSTDDLSDWSTREWQELSPDDFKFDATDCTLSIDLPAGRAVKIDRAATYTGHTKGNEEYFAVQALTIKSSKGLIRYEGLELLHRFERISNSLYVLSYESEVY